MQGWGTALRFARRELRGGVKGFRIFLMCLTLGVAVIAAVGSLTESIVAGLERDARVLLGGDIAIRQIHRPVSPEQSDWLTNNSQRRTDFVEMRAMAVRADGERRTLTQLKAVDRTYPLFGTITLTGPSATPIEANGPVLNDLLARRPTANGASNGDALWGVAIDQALGTRLNVTIGDRLRLGEAEFEIRAFVAKEPDRTVSAVDFGLRTLILEGALEATQLIQPGSLTEYHIKLELPGAVPDTAEWRQALGAAFPEAPWRVRDPRQASPQIERFIERMGLFLTLVGLTALLVGGVGVSNAVAAYLQGKTTTIATLKSLGATGGFIFKVYFLLIVLLAGLGIVVGLGLGALAPYAASATLAAILPVPLALGLYPIALAVAALFGFLTAIAFSLWALGRARDIPAASLFRDRVATAIGRPAPRFIAAIAILVAALAVLAVTTAPQRPLAMWFVGGAAASFLLFRLSASGLMALAKKSGRPRDARLRMALTSLYRPGAPTGSMVLSLGLGITVLVTVALIEGNLSRQVTERMPEQAPNFFFIDIQNTQVDSFDRIIQTAAPGAVIQRVPSLRGRIMKVEGVPASQVKIASDVAWVLDSDRGLTYARTPPDNSKIVAGKWWPSDYRGPLLVSFDKRAADGMGIGVGSKITINVLGRDLEATIANLREIDWGTLGINFVIVLSPGIIEAAPHTHIATVQLPKALNSTEVEERVLKAVGDGLPNVTAVRVKDALDTVAQVLGSIGAAAQAVTVLTLVIGTLVLSGAVIAGHHRRVYDAVVLKVLGATRRDVLGAFLLEYGLLGLATAAIAVVVGSIASWAVVTFLMRAEWVLLPGVLAQTTLVCLAITLVIGLAGTWRALGQKAAPLLREG